MVDASFVCLALSQHVPIQSGSSTQAARWPRKASRILPSSTATNTDQIKHCCETCGRVSRSYQVTWSVERRRGDLSCSGWQASILRTWKSTRRSYSSCSYKTRDHLTRVHHQDARGERASFGELLLRECVWSVLWKCYRLHTFASWHSG